MLVRSTQTRLNDIFKNLLQISSGGWECNIDKSDNHHSCIHHRLVSARNRANRGAGVGRAETRSRRASVIEGIGHDLHWGVQFHCADEFVWEWGKEPKKSEWGSSNLIYIPPYCAHKRFSTGKEEACVVVINSRMMKAMGFDWFDQLEPAEGFEDLWVPPVD